MSATTKIPQERLASYFDTFTKRFLRDASPEVVEVQVVTPVWGDQYVAEGARLIGITYDRHKDSLEFEFDAGDHRVTQPREVWAVEEPDGFLSAIEVIGPDGSQQVVSVKKVGQRHTE